MIAIPHQRSARTFCHSMPTSPRKKKPFRFQTEQNKFSEFKSIQTPEQIINSINTSLNESLTGANDMFEQYDCYRIAFSKMIRKFDNKKHGMLKLKEGYENQISELYSAQRNVHERKIKASASLAFATANVDEMQKKLDNKRAALKDLLERTRKLIVELQEDIVQMTESVKELTHENNEKTVVVVNKRTMIRQFEEDYQSIFTRKEKKDNEYDQYQAEMVEYNKKLATFKVSMDTILDRIYSTKEYIAQAKIDRVVNSEKIEKLKVVVENSTKMKNELEIKCGDVSNDIDKIKSEIEAQSAMNLRIRKAILSLNANDDKATNPNDEATPSANESTDQEPTVENT